MGIDEILKLIDVVQGTDIQELEVANGDWKVRITRNLHQATTHVSQAVPTHYAPALTPVVETGVSSSVVEQVVQNNLHQLTSPMVGTFYRGSEPGAEPYIRENDVVALGQTLCIIEAMKLMNDIPSEMSARVVKILVENGQPVEYGQPLFLLEPV